MKHIEYSKFLINHDSCMSLSKGVYNKDDCAELKIKDSYHTRRSKKNTYHVVNKNIAPSKVTDRRRQKRGCHLGHPQAYAFGCPSILPWGALGIPKLRLLPLLIPKSIKSLLKT